MTFFVHLFLTSTYNILRKQREDDENETCE